MRRINIPLYRFEFMLITGKDKKQAAKELAKYMLNHNVSDQEGYVRDVANWDNPGYCVFFSEPGVPVMYLSTTKDYSTMAHECAHMAIHLCTERGLPINRANQETFAYIMGHMIELITGT